MSEQNQVLVVDDDELIRLMLTRHLEKEGYSVILAENGEEAYEKISDSRPAVVILDLAMPVKSGMDLLRDLPKEIISETSIIVMTGHGGDDELEECYQLGVRSFLTKPVNFYALMGSLRHAFQLHNAQKNLQSANKRLQSILKNVPDLVLEITTDRRICFVSDNVKNILGYEPAEMQDRLLKEFISPNDLTLFEFKFSEDTSITEGAFRNLDVHLIDSQGTEVPFQISANLVEGDDALRAYVAIARDASELKTLQKGIAGIVEELSVQLNEDLEFINPNEATRKMFGYLFDDQNPPRLTDFIQDESSLPLFSYAFDQKEDLPFPVGVSGADAHGNKRSYSVQFLFNDGVLEGTLIPSDSSSQLALMTEKMEQQEEALSSAVLVDPEMAEEILSDCDNLISELLGILKVLEKFAIEEEAVFVFDEFVETARGKNFQEYQEQLRSLSNKLHGLKGSSGFLIPSAKTLCHEIEGITGPLKDLNLVYTDKTAQLFKQFIFKIQELLEQYRKDPASVFEVTEWCEKIESFLEKSEQYIEKDLETFNMFLKERMIDNGEIRNRKTIEYLSVSKDGYFDLSKKVQNIYYSLAYYVPDEEITKAGSLYNEFLAIHQDIKKVPLDLSRYERLIPSIALEYGKKADFIYLDHNVHADMEFWNALHEILNHSLKNSVIHGIEQPQERVELGKDETGKVTVEVSEDALHIFVILKDDGRGLNEEKLKQKALESGEVTEQELRTMTSNEVYNLVFLQGISTAESLDDNAGRGVGLNAVMEAMNHFRGTCHISSNLKQGVIWSFTFPKSSVSISSYIVSLDSYKIAIPEENIVYFQRYFEKDIQILNDIPVYSFQSELIPVIQLDKNLDSGLKASSKQMRRMLIVESAYKKMALVINEIIHHETLPVFPLPDEYQDMDVYTGLTMYSGEPVLMLNVQHFQEQYEELPAYG